MKDINLLPRAHKEKLLYGYFVKKLTAVTAVFFLCALLIVFILNGTCGWYEAKAAEYTRLIDDPRFREPELVARTLRQKEDELAQSKKASEFLKDGRREVRVGHVLAIGDEIGGGLSVTELSMRAGVISVTARAEDKQQVIAFAGRLAAAKLFSHVEIFQLVEKNDSVNFVIRLGADEGTG